MNKNRCQRRKKEMMGRRAEEKPCPISSRVPANIPVGVDLYSQARKALTERSPFDVWDAGSAANDSLSLTCYNVRNLPRGLIGHLAKSSSDPHRKRHKKSHSSGNEYHSNKKKSSSKKERGLSIWIETEEYFRELNLLDIERLYDASTLKYLAGKNCFNIPSLEDTDIGNGNSNANVVVVNRECSSSNGLVVKEEEEKKEEERKEEVGVKEDGKEEFMEIDGVGGEVKCEGEKICSELESSGLEWLLGSKNRYLLTSERPNKKRKLLGEDAGLEKLIVGRPCEGNLTLCNVCSLGEDDERFSNNGLVVCSSCNVAIHRKCYGVQADDVSDSWVCSWCNHRNDAGLNVPVENPCVLCPKQGGALKPVHSGDDGNVEFAHLFCSLWMPEVYVEDTKTMEPIMNVDGIPETRRKLICNICKVKYGACIRCSNGACRTSFHPTCAREASHRTEIWGKLGSDNVELRAFCSKHSEIQNLSGTQTGDLRYVSKHKLRISPRNGDKIAVEIGAVNTNELGDSEVKDKGFSDRVSNTNLMSECGDAKDKEYTNLEPQEKANIEDVKPSVAFTLKRLIDRGKVNAKEIAMEIGTSSVSLAASLANDNLVPEIQSKVIGWLKNHAFMGLGGLQRNLKVKLNSTISSDEKIGVADGSEAVLESDIPNVVPVKSVPPRRRTQSNIRIWKDDKMTHSPKEMPTDNGSIVNEVEVDQRARNSDSLIEEAVSDSKEKIVSEPVLSSNSSERNSLESETDTTKPPNQSLHGSDQAEDDGVTEHRTLLSFASVVNTIIPDKIIHDMMNSEGASGSYIHPYIYKKLMQMQSGELLKEMAYKREREFSSLEASSSAGMCCNPQNRYSSCNGVAHKNDVKLQQLSDASRAGVINLSPQDEVEGELIYFQHRLLNTAITRKHFSDNLIFKAVKNLYQEMDIVRSRRWDSVLLDKYLSELREAKKQGRKERRHKEAQAVLAAATAAAASSSRISSLRKDAFEESAHQESLLTEGPARVGIQSQLLPRAKETLPRVALSRISSEKHSDYLQSASEMYKEHPRSCDICRRSETLLNAILVCSSCKVAVHLDCYRSVKDSTGPWHCELCEDLLSSRSARSPAVNSWEKPFFVAECGICGGTTGALRKSTDNQWIHAFCAEWVFESTFRRGQVNPIEGMETVRRDIEVCCVCRHRKGVCIKCHYGHCQSTFHPSCARSAGFYMNSRTGAGKLQHKAYCEKHSLGQRAKAENQRHGIDELKNIKHMRVELERLRLLCERIVKREKLKRDLVLCSHEILASKRDSVAFSALVRRPYFPPDVSSESATTSLHHSCSEAMQKSDDMTVDSTSVKHNLKLRLSMDNDQRTDDISASQHVFPLKPTERLLFSGKKIPLKSLSPSQNSSDDRETRSKTRKPPETFEKELVMTSDQATMKNQRLPKGFVYVPVGCLQDDNKQSNKDACSPEPLDGDG